MFLRTPYIPPNSNAMLIRKIHIVRSILVACASLDLLEF